MKEAFVQATSGAFEVKGLKAESEDLKPEVLWGER
jgi:hypothetical protein